MRDYFKSDLHILAREQKVLFEFVSDFKEIVGVGKTSYANKIQLLIENFVFMIC